MVLLASFSNTLKLASHILEVGAFPRKIVIEKNGNFMHFEKIRGKSRLRTPSRGQPAECAHDCAHNYGARLRTPAVPAALPKRTLLRTVTCVPKKNTFAHSNLQIFGPHFLKHPVFPFGYILSYRTISTVKWGNSGHFFFSSRRRHTRSSTVSWARRCV